MKTNFFSRALASDNLQVLGTYSIYFHMYMYASCKKYQPKWLSNIGLSSFKKVVETHFLKVSSVCRDKKNSIIYRGRPPSQCSQTLKKSEIWQNPTNCFVCKGKFFEKVNMLTIGRLCKGPRPNSPGPITDDWKVTDDSSVNFHGVFLHFLL